MDESHAIEVASRFARSQGRNPDDYEVLSVRESDGLLCVLFQGRSGQPGDHFAVYVDPTQGEALRLVRGR